MIQPTSCQVTTIVPIATNSAPASKSIPVTKKLSPEELYENIINKEIIRHSTLVRDRWYKTYYKVDHSYVRYTFEGKKYMGETNGTWQIIPNKKGEGLLVRYYNEIHPNKEIASIFCPQNPNSIFYTKTLTSGPYKLKFKNDVCNVLSVYLSLDDSIGFITAYTLPEHPKNTPFLVTSDCYPLPM
jgi:hypothetical protein